MKRTLQQSLSSSQHSSSQPVYGPRIRVRATIPFDFTVNTGRAGRNLHHQFHLLGCAEHFIRSEAFHLMTTALMDPSNDGKANVLVFHKYGDQYFLSEIRSKDSSSMNLRLPVWKAEKRAQAARTQEAGIPLSSDVHGRSLLGTSTSKQGPETIVSGPSLLKANVLPGDDFADEGLESGWGWW